MPKAKVAAAKSAATVPASEPAEDFLPLVASAVPAQKRSKAPRLGKARSTPRSTDAKEGEPSASSSEMSSVVYIGHIPHGFYDKEMLGFFSQFGKLLHVRMSKNKMGKSRHYAFIQFQHQAVAEIAVSAMDGYFLMKQRLHCRLLKTSEVHPRLFAGANRTFRNRTRERLARERHRQNRERTPEEHAKKVAAAVLRDTKRQAKILAAGMDFTYDTLSTKLPATATKTFFDE